MPKAQSPSGAGLAVEISTIDTDDEVGVVIIYSLIRY